jgi:hypothetical protein
MEERIDAYVLGSLSAEERAAMEAARRFDPSLDQAIEDAEDRLAPLSLAAGSVTPSPALWDRIEAALDEEIGAHSGRINIALDEGNWRPLCPGIMIKPLWNSANRLLRCAPGAILPPHDHDEDEHVLVLEGDLVIGGRTLTSGDYHGSRRGHGHGPLTTRGGCLILVSTVA